jgi:3',5'-cyclic AMP phosphodiesterase CpdA
MGTDSKKVRIVCISDTHNKAPGEGYTLPKGDVLIHAGDLSNQGSYHELKRAADWLEKADFAVKIVVAGKLSMVNRLMKG